MEPIAKKERYEIAGLRVVMTTYYDRMRKKAADYLTKNNWKEEDADVEIFLEHDFYIENIEGDEKKLPIDSLEYIYTGELFNRYILKHHGCMLHSSAVVVDDYAYLFSADSGTGKSTHTAQWLKYFGDRAYIINDDKPTLRRLDGIWYAYGTPWSGKTDLNKNKRVRLGAIVFLERSKENWIEEISVTKAIPKFFNQTIRRLNKEENVELVLKNMEEILLENPIYQMGCNISENAVKTAYNKIRRV